jgi:hypothetical protein
VASEVLPGERLAERAAALLGSDTAFLHVHFAGPGCFAFRIDPVGRPTEPAPPLGRRADRDRVPR